MIATKLNLRMDEAGPADMATVGPRKDSAEHVRSSIEGSLERLGTDYVVLYYKRDSGPPQLRLRGS